MENFTEQKKVSGQKYPIAIFIFFAFIIILFTGKTIKNINPASRFLTMESLVEQGSFAITEKNNYTCDKISRGGEYYSSKPPVLTAVGAGIYYVLHNMFNLNLPQGGIIDYLDEINISVYIITFALAGAPYLLLLFYFYKTLNLFKIEGLYKTLLMLGLGFGTLYLPYSTTLNNHTAGGSFLFIGFFYLLKTKLAGKNENKKKYMSLSGFFTSAAAVIDLPTGLTFLLLFALYYLFTGQKKYLFFYIFSTTPLLAAHLYLNFIITGSFIPPQFSPELWIHDKSIITKHNIFRYTFNIFFGARGLFFYTPILLISFYGIFKTLRKKSNIFFNEAFLIIFGFSVIALFYIIRIRNYAGFAYGFRWFIAATPLLYFFTIFPLSKKMVDKEKNYFIFLLAISITFSSIGLYNPWPVPELTTKIKNKEITIHSPLLSNINSILSPKKIKNSDIYLMAGKKQ